jgi:predicted Zn-dependent protease
VRRTIVWAVLTAAVLAAQIREPRPGFNLFSKEQDVQLGKEAAAQVEKEFELVQNAELQRYIDSIGSKLTRSKRAADFPYTFKVVSDDSINAFALPGGPMFIHTGLIKAAENEAQLAGVMAHEISHVALRHGTNQASKANLIQLPALLGSQLAGKGLIGSLAQMGIGLGANSVLLNFSRGAETQADTNGALMMSDAGYNPMEMARFFEKLEAESGKRGRVAQFFSSHPNPGNRVKSVESLVQQLPRQQFSTGDNSGLGRAQAIVYKLPPPKKKPAQQQQTQQPQR